MIHAAEKSARIQRRGRPFPKGRSGNPNGKPPGTRNKATVLLEATLSYLGIGVQPPTPSWGNIIFENQTYFQSAPWLVIFPGVAILLLALAFNLLGDALRDVLDPTQRGRN